MSGSQDSDHLPRKILHLWTTPATPYVTGQNPDGSYEVRFMAFST